MFFSLQHGKQHSVLNSKPSICNPWLHLSIKIEYLQPLFTHIYVYSSSVCLIFTCLISFVKMLHFKRLPGLPVKIRVLVMHSMIQCWCFNKAPIHHHTLNCSIQLIIGHYGDVAVWMLVPDNQSLPAFGSDWGQTWWATVCGEKLWSVFYFIFLRFTTLRLASCSFRALSSSLLARTASSVFFLLSRLTFSSVSGALLFRWTHGKTNIIRQSLWQMITQSQKQLSSKAYWWFAEGLSPACVEIQDTRKVMIYV